ncbi:hypothetical protein EJ04DRAFT_507711 [Polyplosphaeria fusca]|uniref:Secreted protein n=1 Tax=Polyplosphaeria fusca TaxID=682080 RepID=A0A9P4R7Y2_9PLEO|nr:hypothetical protein EJ04DRAFT_507711 [Polyplosphaeria fusca]
MSSSYALSFSCSFACLVPTAAPQASTLTPWPRTSTSSPAGWDPAASRAEMKAYDKAATAAHRAPKR